MRIRDAGGHVQMAQDALDRNVKTGATVRQEGHWLNPVVGWEIRAGKEVVANVIQRGAFTGAVESFRGVIRAAEGGTLFLDEIGDLERMMREGRFREDLYHGLNVVHFRVPHARSVIQNRDLSPKVFEERATPPPVTSDDARALSVRVDRPLPEIARDVEIAALTYAMRHGSCRLQQALDGVERCLD